MSRKVDVSRMLDTGDTETGKRTHKDSRAAHRVRQEDAETAGKSDAQTPQVARYRQAIPKEARLWPEQIPQLDALARRLQQAKPTGGERITSNTLLRLAAAWIVQHADTLEGQTEQELAKTLGLDNYPPE